MKKAAAIGAGIFGLYCAIELLKSDFQVDIYEQAKCVGQGASKANQARLHLGYHYPHSRETEVQSKGVEIVSGSEYPFCSKKTAEGGTYHRHGKANHNREPSVKGCLGQPGRMGTEESAGVHPVSSGGRDW